jgi:hypothetical protein
VFEVFFSEEIFCKSATAIYCGRLKQKLKKLKLGGDGFLLKIGLNFLINN